MLDYEVCLCMLGILDVVSHRQADASQTYYAAKARDFKMGLVRNMTTTALARSRTSSRKSYPSDMATLAGWDARTTALLAKCVTTMNFGHEAGIGGLQVGIGLGFADWPDDAFLGTHALARFGYHFLLLACPSYCYAII